MLSSQFYSQITTCPSCKGWGTNDVPPKSEQSCKECGGLGIFLVQTDQTFIWGLPTFINFKRRTTIIFLRIIFVFILLILFFVIYYFLSQIKIPKFEFPIK